MHAHRLTAGWNRPSGALVVPASWLLVFVSLISAVPAFADDEPDPDSVKSSPSQPTPRTATEVDDGFLPITKVVPRAKIVLRERERLPDRKAEKTFAAFGTRSVSPDWSLGESVVPMYSIAHHPLYFEDMNLERCGLSCGCCLQPVVSGLQFFGTVALLPYKMLVSPPCSYVFPPGECPPGCRFSHCENVIGPKPDFGSLYGYGSFWRKAKCPQVLQLKMKCLPQRTVQARGEWGGGCFDFCRSSSAKEQALSVFVQGDPRQVGRFDGAHDPGRIGASCHLPGGFGLARKDLQVDGSDFGDGPGEDRGRPFVEG